MNDARSPRRRFGQVSRMRSGRWQARFTVPLGHPCGRGGETITAPHTFEPTTYGKEAAGDWLRDEERRLNAEGAAWATLDEHAEAERVRAEREAVVTFAEFSATWLRTRRTKNGPLQESTRRGYRIWLDKYLLPTLGDLPLDQITPTVVLRWYEDALPHDKPKTTRECYALGSAIMRTATAADGVLAGAVNPFKIDGAGSFGARSRARTEVIDEHDLLVITSTIRPEWRAMVALALRLRAAVRRDHCAPPVRYRSEGDTACRAGHPRCRNRPRRAPIREGPQDHGGNDGISAYPLPSSTLSPNTCGRTSPVGTDSSSPPRMAVGCPRRGFGRLPAAGSPFARRWGARSTSTTCGRPAPRGWPSGGRMSTKSRCSSGTARPKRPSAT